MLMTISYLGPRQSNQGNNLVEVNALEFLPGDHYKRYMVVVPTDIRRGQTFRVSLDGRLMTVAVPENVSPGDAIYVRDINDLEIFSNFTLQKAIKYLTDEINYAVENDQLDEFGLPESTTSIEDFKN
jgi:hypothetical protein